MAFSRDTVPTEDVPVAQRPRAAENEFIDAVESCLPAAGGTGAAKIMHATSRAATIQLTLDGVLQMIIAVRPMTATGAPRVEAVSVLGLNETIGGSSGERQFAAGLRSRHHVFQSINECATVAAAGADHYCTSTRSAPLKGFLGWASGYKNLFSMPCAKCGRILAASGDVALPPTWRDFSPVGIHGDPYHAECAAAMQP